jgi:hypothetical protein
MGFIAAGLAVAAIGAGVSAYGTAQNAAAQKDAAQAAALSQQGLFDRQNQNLTDLINQKENKLYNAGNIFDRFKSTGAFGDTTTLENLRTAQQDFSNLAAGDFTGFEAQLKKSMGDALLSTGQSGAPIGTFAGLAADQQMQYRKEGLSAAIGVTDFLSNQTNQLLGQEFGIMDQKFNTGYQLDRDRVLGVNASNQQAAAQTGVGTIAYGNAGQSIGSSLLTYGMYNGSQQAPRPQYAQASNGSMMQVPAYGSPLSSYQQFAPPQSYRTPTASVPQNYTPIQSSTPAPILPVGAIPENGSFANTPDSYNLGVLPPRSDVYQGSWFDWAGSGSSSASSALSSVGASIVANLGK